MADPLQPRRMLVVDDEENILRALQRVVRRDGYEIRTATSGEAGLAELARFPAGVIISDQRMPGMSGAEFLGQVKERYPDTVRLMLSGYTDLRSVTDGINRGEVYKFLTKPWDDELLRTNIREAFEHYELRTDNERLTRDLMEANRKLERMVLDQHRSLDLQQRMLDLSREVLEQLPVGVLGLDQDGTIALANGSAHRLLDLPAGSLVGRDAVRVLDGPLQPLLGDAARLELDDQRLRCFRAALGSTDGVQGRILVLIPEETA